MPLLPEHNHRASSTAKNGYLVRHGAAVRHSPAPGIALLQRVHRTLNSALIWMYGVLTPAPTKPVADGVTVARAAVDTPAPREVRGGQCCDADR